MNIPAERKKDNYTYQDYISWSDGTRWELIDGIAYNMTPAPSRRHQEVSRELLLQFAGYLRNHQCQVYSAPFDVRLPEGDEKVENII